MPKQESFGQKILGEVHFCQDQYMGSMVGHEGQKVVPFVCSESIDVEKEDVKGVMWAGGKVGGFRVVDRGKRSFKGQVRVFGDRMTET
jgi:hypothetical protein